MHHFLWPKKNKQKQTKNPVSCVSSWNCSGISLWFQFGNWSLITSRGGRQATWRKGNCKEKVTRRSRDGLQNYKHNVHKGKRTSCSSPFDTSVINHLVRQWVCLFFHRSHWPVNLFHFQETQALVSLFQVGRTRGSGARHSCTLAEWRVRTKSCRGPAASGGSMTFWLRVKLHRNTWSPTRQELHMCKSNEICFEFLFFLKLLKIYM